MQRQVVLEKLESLRRCLERVRDHCPESAEQLQRNIDAQDIISLNLTRAVQLAVDIAAHLLAGSGQTPPETMGRTFEQLAEGGTLTDELAQRMKAAVGFRNISIHSYRDIDWKIVYSICAHNLDDFERFARAVLAALE